MRTLDRSRPFGMIYPSGLFEQDNIVFNRDGTERVEPLVEPVAPVEAAPAVEDDPPEARRIDLRLKENAHLRPSAQARKAAGK